MFYKSVCIEPPMETQRVELARAVEFDVYVPHLVLEDDSTRPSKECAYFFPPTSDYNNTEYYSITMPEVTFKRAHY